MGSRALEVLKMARARAAIGFHAYEAIETAHSRLSGRWDVVTSHDARQDAFQAFADATPHAPDGENPARTERFIEEWEGSEAEALEAFDLAIKGLSK